MHGLLGAKGRDFLSLNRAGSSDSDLSGLTPGVMTGPARRQDLRRERPLPPLDRRELFRALLSLDLDFSFFCLFEGFDEDAASVEGGCSASASPLRLEGLASTVGAAGGGGLRGGALGVVAGGVPSGS